MDLKKIRITLFQKRETTRGFNCGEREIDGWFCDKAYKWHEQNRSKVFTAHLDGNDKAVGFYSLAVTSENSDKLVRDDRSRYPSGFLIIYIGYLGVMRNCQNGGLGTLLLLNALERSYSVSQHVAFYGVGLRSLNDRTTELYRRYGFEIAPEEKQNPLMILNIWTLNDLFQREDS